MIKTPRRLLYVRPKHPATDPILDDLTSRITEAFRTRKSVGVHYLGYHTCVCGAESASCDYVIAIGMYRFQINSLAVHYVACHRNEVSESDLAIVKLVIPKTFYSVVRPTDDELHPKYGRLT